MKNKNSFEQKLKNRKINENLSILGRNELLNPCFHQLVYGTTLLFNVIWWPFTNETVTIMYYACEAIAKPKI